MLKLDNSLLPSALLKDASIKAEASKDIPTDLYDVANQFEALFITQILKQARQTKLAESPFDSFAGDSYQTMLDEEYAGMLSDKVNLGIAEALLRQFGRHVT